jgi:hypothetical protein
MAEILPTRRRRPIAARPGASRDHVPGQLTAPVVRHVELVARAVAAAALMPRAVGDAACRRST